MVADDNPTFIEPSEVAPGEQKALEHHPPVQGGKTYEISGHYKGTVTIWSSLIELVHLYS